MKKNEENLGKVPEFIQHDIDNLINHSKIWAESENLPTPAVFIHILSAEPRKGSFQNTEADLSVLAMYNEGNMVARVEAFMSIIAPIPSCHYKLIFEALYAAKEERIEWEIQNEENGISPPIGTEIEE